MDDKQAFFVQSVDGRKFKMVIRGDLGRLSVGKIRRYLKSYGVPEDQMLLHNGVPLSDNAVGEEFGLCQHAVLQLAPAKPGTTKTVSLNEKGDETLQPSLKVTDSCTSPSSAIAELRDYSSQGLSSRVYTNGLTTHEDPRNMLEVRHGVHRSIASALNNSNANNNNSSSSCNVNSNNNNIDANNSTSALSTALEIENLQLREEVQRLRQEVSALSERHQTRGNTKNQDPVSVDLLSNAKANLHELSEELGIPLQFDMNLTCVVGTDERHTVLVTFDQPTERLYVYSTLLTHLPEDANVRVKLYELLLEGSLLGREVCGGGIGLSLQNGIVVLSTTIPLRACIPSALREIMPTFTETITRWRLLVNELIE